MTCPECHGTSFETGLYEVADIIDRRPVLLTNVPAQRCRQCGFLVISSQVSKQIELRLAEPPTATMSMPVFDLTDPSAVGQKERTATGHRAHP